MKRTQQGPPVEVEVQAAVFDSPGKRTSKASQTGQVPGRRRVLGFMLIEAKTAEGDEIEVMSGHTLVWQGKRHEIDAAQRWAGEEHDAPAENPQTFWQFEAVRVVR